MLVALLVQRSRQQVLRQIVLTFLFIPKIAVARVKALGQQEQATQAVTVSRELGGMTELILVPVGMVGPSRPRIRLCPASNTQDTLRCDPTAFLHSR